MTVDWRQGLIVTLVGGATAGLVSFMLNRLDINPNMISALSIGLGIGTSRLVAGWKPE